MNFIGNLAGFVNTLEFLFLLHCHSSGWHSFTSIGPCFLFRHPSHVLLLQIFACKWVCVFLFWTLSLSTRKATRTIFLENLLLKDKVNIIQRKLSPFSSTRNYIWKHSLFHRVSFSVRSNKISEPTSFHWSMYRNENRFRLRYKCITLTFRFELIHFFFWIIKSSSVIVFSPEIPV